MTIEEFRKKIEDWYDEVSFGINDFSEHVLTWEIPDPVNVEIETENLEWGEGWGLDKILGWHNEGGLCWLGFYAGGDWQHPIVFIVYWSEKKQSPIMYVPKEGNVVDWESGQPYYLDDYEEDEYGRPVPDGADFDEDLLLEDILKFLGGRDDK